MEMTELVVGGRMQASPCPVATWWDHSLLVPGLLLRLPCAPVVLLGTTSGPWYSPWAGAPSSHAWRIHVSAEITWQLGREHWFFP